MPEESSLAVQPEPFVKASTILGHALGMETGMLIDTLKAQFFKNVKPEQVSDAQLATVIAVANALRLNPLLPGQLYPYPERSGGVTIMLGPDGIYTLLANNSDIVATKEGGPAWWVEHGKDAAGKETCTAFINHRMKGLLKKTIWVDEWVVATNPNWASRKKHMSEIRALKQCARQVVHGIPPDMDEKRLGDMLNVTESDQPETVKRADAPPKAATTGAAAAMKVKMGKTRGKEVEVTNVVEGDFRMDPSKLAEPVTTLGDKESRTFVCTINEFTTAWIDSGGASHPSVRVTLDGGFKGAAIHLGGAKANPEEGKPPVADPTYQLDKPVEIKLTGRARKAKLVDGKEVPQPAAILVESVKIAEAAAPEKPPETPAPEPAKNESVD